MSFLKKQSLLSVALFTVILIWGFLFLMTAAAAFMCSREILPVGGMKISIILIEILSIFIVATPISGVYAKKYLVFCLLCAGVYSLSFAIISSCLGNTLFSIKWIVENIAYCALAGIVAAFVHIPRKKYKRRRK